MSLEEAREEAATRYPNGLPELTPADVFSEKDSVEAIEVARRIIGAVSDRMSA